MSLDAHPDAGPGESRAGNRYRSSAKEHGSSVGLDEPAVDNGNQAGSGVGDADHHGRPVWSFQQLQSVTFQVALVLIVFSMAGLVFASPGPGQYVARTEFVYTLDESVPDSFLREDRRLLTQIATLRSDSVLMPVAETFGLETEDLRDKIEIETIDLSEVIRLEVLDADPQLALAISGAVVDQYLILVTKPPPTGVSEALDGRRAELLDSLAAADSSLLALRQSRLVDPGLATSEESLERQIDFRTDQINRLQALLDDSLVKAISRTRTAGLEEELTESQDILATLESDLADLRVSRAEIAAESAVESALERDIERFEDELDTIDGELARRELRPLIASPIRVLSEPTVTVAVDRLAQLRGPAIGLLLAIPFAAILVFRARKRQLWFGQ